MSWTPDLSSFLSFLQKRSRLGSWVNPEEFDGKGPPNGWDLGIVYGIGFITENDLELGLARLSWCLADWREKNTQKLCKAQWNNPAHRCIQNVSMKLQEGMGAVVSGNWTAPKLLDRGLAPPKAKDHRLPPAPQRKTDGPKPDGWLKSIRKN